MQKRMALIAVLAAAYGCTSPPAKPPALIDTSDCRAVEGAPIRQNHKGQPVYKYICGGKGVWLTPKY